MRRMNSSAASTIADADRDHHVEDDGQREAREQHGDVALAARRAAMCTKCRASLMFHATSSSSAASEAIGR